MTGSEIFASPAKVVKAFLAYTIGLPSSCGVERSKGESAEAGCMKETYVTVEDGYIY